MPKNRSNILRKQTRAGATATSCFGLNAHQKRLLLRCSSSTWWDVGVQSSWSPMLLLATTFKTVAGKDNQERKKSKKNTHQTSWKLSNYLENSAKYYWTKLTSDISDVFRNIFDEVVFHKSWVSLATTWYWIRPAFVEHLLCFMIRGEFGLKCDDQPNVIQRNTTCFFAHIFECRYILQISRHNRQQFKASTGH